MSGVRLESADQPSRKLKNGLHVCLRRDSVIVFKPGEPRKLLLRERFLEWLAAVLMRDPGLTSVARALGGVAPTLVCVGKVDVVILPDGTGGLVFLTSQGEADQDTQGEIVDMFYNTFIMDNEHEQATQTH